MSSQNEKISVIVPVYNVGEFLVDCVSSVQAQTYQHWELLLIDDGSTDGCSAICDAFAKASSRIHVYHQNNKGVSAARNVGIQNAAGEYLCFLDADDWLEPNYLQTLLKGMSNCECSLCGVEDIDREPLWDEVITLGKMRQMPSRYTKNVYINYCINRLYRLSIIRENRLLFCEGMQRGEDAVFVLQYLSYCKRISTTKQLLYHYRFNMASATHHFCATICQDEAILTSAQYEFFHQSPLSAAENTAYLIWEHGKCMEVLRQIIRYATNRYEKNEMLRLALEIPRFKQSCSYPPKILGPKSKLYAFLIRHRQISLFGNILGFLQ